MSKELKPNESLSDVVLSADEKSLLKTVTRIAIRLDERLKDGSDFMRDLKGEMAIIKKMIKDLPCKIPVQTQTECSSKKGIGFISGVLATISFIGVGAFMLFDALKPYGEKIIKLISIITKGAN